ncbi:hypothetical protein J3D49_004436 [Pseudomonas kilonensis]|nr:hypothetical protein [Pseudomonas kilonensis]
MNLIDDQMKNSLEIRARRAKLPSLADYSQTGCGQ